MLAFRDETNEWSRLEHIGESRAYQHPAGNTSGLDTSRNSFQSGRLCTDRERPHICFAGKVSGLEARYHVATHTRKWLLDRHLPSKRVEASALHNPAEATAKHRQATALSC